MFPPTYRYERGSRDCYLWQKYKSSGVRLSISFILSLQLILKLLKHPIYISGDMIGTIMCDNTDYNY